MKKSTLVLLLLICLAVISFLFYRSSNNKDGVICTEDVKICSDGTSLRRSGSSCEFPACPLENEIVVDSPRAFQNIKSPLVIKGSARGGWYFEASFPVKVLDAEGNVIGQAPATTADNWMTNDFVSFEASISFSAPQTDNGFVVLQNDNPSGLPENQKELRIPVVFTKTDQESRVIKLYYYNPEKDKDAEGNVMCSEAGLVAVEKEIPVTMSPIKDVISLLLKGRQNLTAQDIALGINTEYPLDGFSLAEANLKSDGTLVLRFNDPQNRSVGGACRVGILWSQIAKTARQFNNVSAVEFLPEELFQP